MLGINYQKIESNSVGYKMRHAAPVIGGLQ